MLLSTRGKMMPASELRLLQGNVPGLLHGQLVQPTPASAIMLKSNGITGVWDGFSCPANTEVCCWGDHTKSTRAKQFKE